MKAISFVYGYFLCLVTGVVIAASVNNNPAPVVYHNVGVELHIRPDAQVEQSMAYWKQEAHRRFQAPLLIIGHGITFNHVWCMWLQESNKIVPVREVVLEAQKRNPGRVIVLICCNPCGELLHMPGVYHAMDSVWFDPDKRTDNTKRSSKDPGCVGNIYEFVDD